MLASINNVLYNRYLPYFTHFIFRVLFFIFTKIVHLSITIITNTKPKYVKLYFTTTPEGIQLSPANNIILKNNYGVHLLRILNQ